RRRPTAPPRPPAGHRRRWRPRPTRARRSRPGRRATRRTAVPSTVAAGAAGGAAATADRGRRRAERARPAMSHGRVSPAVRAAISALVRAPDVACRRGGGEHPDELDRLRSVSLVQDCGPSRNVTPDRGTALVLSEEVSLG